MLLPLCIIKFHTLWPVGLKKKNVSSNVMLAQLFEIISSSKDLEWIQTLGGNT